MFVIVAKLFLKTNENICSLLTKIKNSKKYRKNPVPFLYGLVEGKNLN